jgi:hypothetical protein
MAKLSRLYTEKKLYILQVLSSRIPGWQRLPVLGQLRNFFHFFLFFLVFLIFLVFHFSNFVFCPFF